MGCVAAGVDSGTLLLFGVEVLFGRLLLVGIFVESGILLLVGAVVESGLLLSVGAVAESGLLLPPGVVAVSGLSELLGAVDTVESASGVFVTLLPGAIEAVVFAPGALVALLPGAVEAVEIVSAIFLVFTVTLHFKVVFWVTLAEVNFTVTLITALPVFFAVTLPFLVTAATFLLVLVNFWLRIFTPADFFNLSVLEAPGFRVSLVFESETGFLAAWAADGSTDPQIISDAAHSHAISFFFIRFLLSVR